MPSACIDGKLLEQLFGGKVTISKDAGQRKACNCVRSKDIGGVYSVKNLKNKLEENTYRNIKQLNKPCKALCRYCYGNVEDS